MTPGTLETHWGLTGVKLAAEVASYRTRTCFEVVANEGTFFAKVDHRPLVTRPLGSAHVLAHLTATGFRHAPNLVETRTGQPTLTCDGRTITLMEFVPQKFAATLEAWHELGRVVARLHRVADYEVAYAVPIGVGIDEVVAWASNHGHPPIELPSIAQRCRELEAAIPVGLVHGEINAANVRRRADGSLVLVDWDEAGFGPTALDVGTPLISSFVSEDDFAFDGSSAAAYISGYVDGGGAFDHRAAFNGALLHALRHVRHGNTDARWKRLRHAFANEGEITAIVADARHGKRAL